MIVQAIKMAIKAIGSNKLRSFLTMLGIIIGVFSLVVLVSIASGATGDITSTISDLGSTKLQVTVSDDHNHPFKLDTLSEVTELDSIEMTAPVATDSFTASTDYAEETAFVTGTTASYADICGLELGSGRFIMTPDVDNNLNVAVVNSDFASDIMGRTNVTGETFKLDGKTFTIIGVLEAEDSTSGELAEMMGSSYEVYIPYTSLIRMSDSVSLTVTTFYVKAANDDTDTAESELDAFLLKRFSEDEDAYTLYNESSIAEAMESVTNTLALLLGGIAAISLLVGGIGIMNIMLVSVTERTREIGIRKAIGASRGVILAQFLIESLILSLTGCLIGILLSWVAVLVVNVAGDVNYSLNLGVSLGAVIFSLGIGLIFGLYPANKAAGKNPIDALRFN